MKPDMITDRLIERMTWDWQSAEDLIQEIIPMIPPGKAHRTYLGKNNVKTGTGSRPLSEDEQIASGARTLINARLNTLMNSGRIELETRANRFDRYVRFAERRVVDKHGNCPTCYRPFIPASEAAPAPKRNTKVLYPSFPSWQKEFDRKTVEGS